MLTRIPDPIRYPYDRVEVWEPAPYCKLVYDDPIYHRGIRFCLMFRIPQLLPLVPIRLEKRYGHHESHETRLLYADDVPNAPPVRVAFTKTLTYVGWAELEPGRS